MKILILLLLLVQPIFAYAGGVVYGEHANIQTLASLVGTYVAVKNGQLPHSWEDLAEVGGDIATLSRYYTKIHGRRLEENYIFINEEFDIPRGVGRGRILLIRVNPIRRGDNTFDQRPFVYMQDGKIGGTFFPEVDVEKMFAGAGKEIPGKGSKADYESLVNGKPQYVAAEATPTPIAEQPLQTHSTPSQTVHFQTPTTSPDVQSTSNLAEKPSSGMLMLATVILAGLLAGALVFFMWKK